MHPLAPLGNLFQVIALIVSVALGLMSKPALISIFAGSLAFTIGYIFVRFPQMLGMYRTDGLRILLLFIYLLLGNSLLAAILYGIGLGISRVFS